MGASLSTDHSSSQHKSKCCEKREDGSVKCGSSGRCHCTNKRKHRVKRSIKVSAISKEAADIPLMSIPGGSMVRSQSKVHLIQEDTTSAAA